MPPSRFLPFPSLSAALTMLAALVAPMVCTQDLAAQSKVMLDKEIKIKEWGYQFRPIKDWNPMPADQDDRKTVGRWKLDLSEFEKRGNYEALSAGRHNELMIVRIQTQAETPSGASSNSGKESALPAGWDKKLNPKTIEELIESRWDGASKRWLRQPLKGGKMPGEILDFGSGDEHITIGMFRHMGVEWAMVYVAYEENYSKTWKDIYIKSMQTFKVTEKVDDKVVQANNKDISKLEGEEKREALHASIAGNPGWYYIDTKYYVFLSNANRQFVERLAKDIEAVREAVYIPTFKPRNEKIPLSPVRVFATQSEYHLFGGPGGSAGYFAPSKGELVLFEKFEDQSATKSQSDCRSVMFHEGFHQYIHFAVGDVSPHSWFNEGHGDYFAGLQVSNGKVASRVEPFDWRVRFLKDHMQGGRDLIPLRSLLRYPQSEYYQNPGLKYSQGWAVIYYLRQVTKDKAQREALETYFNYLADNVTAFRAKKKSEEGDEDDKPRGEPVPGIPGLRVFDFENQAAVDRILSEAVDKAFATIDLEALDAELRAWINKL
ncbi:MAG: hypothetical protein JNN13_01225 [Planctomycetes bacterium]|nr:hypothetical protein [Planctomycetota bacterium]